MAHLLHKPTSLDGCIGKVYFCCHPQDASRFFDPVSKDILSRQNCSFWYAPEDAVRDAQFLEDLKEMQLFVMPVSRLLLNTNNVAKDVEFPFAMANNIPVLPLLQEPGLEASFSRVFGDLQSLYPHCTDQTALDYDEKLRRYLQSVLIGDAMADKIRAAFQAYVFLSYRKKDRQYAKQLMQLIRKNPFCRDVAIWYDEFLTPGEDFNQSIRAALRKSNLFLMAVTPNITEKDNYVIKNEYPDAKKMGKPILPAELLPTPRALLDGAFPQLPEPVDAYNAQLLSQALSVALQPCLHRDDSPLHAFFIGLAYLGGVDVEVDTERGAQLITQSAESGCPEAMEKLEQMYRNGQGVVRDITRSLFWRKQRLDVTRRQLLADLQEKKQRTEPDGNTIEQMVVRYERMRALQFFTAQLDVKITQWASQQRELAQLYRQAGDLQSGIDLLLDTLLFLSDHWEDKLYQLSPTGIISTQSADCTGLDLHRLLVDFLVQDHAYQLADSWICKTADQFRERNRHLPQQTRIMEAKLQILRMQILCAKGDYRAALDFMDTPFQAIRAIYDAPTDPFDPQANLDSMAFLFTSQDIIYALSVELTEVAAIAEQALGLTADFCDSCRGIIKGLDLAHMQDEPKKVRCYLHLANLDVADKALCLEEAAKRLVALPKTDLRYLPLHRDLLVAQGDCAQALQLAQELVQDAPTPENLLSLAQISLRLCQQDPLQNLSQIDLLEQLLETHSKLLHTPQGMEYLGDIYHILFRMDNREGSLRSAYSIYAQLAEQHPQCVRFAAKRDALPPLR